MPTYDYISGQSEVRLPYTTQPTSIDLGNNTWALYTLNNTIQDYFDNFSNLVVGKPITYAFSDYGFAYDAFYFDNIHYLKTSTDPSGLTLEDLLKTSEGYNASNAIYQIGLQFMLESFPVSDTFRWILFTGNANQYFGIKILSDGKITYERYSNGISDGPYEIATVLLEQWYSIVVVHNQADTTQCGVYFNGVFCNFNSPLKVDGDSVDRITPIQFGHGPEFSSTLVSPAWDSNISASGFNYSTDFLTVSSESGSGYGTAGTSSVITEEGDYYFELQYLSGRYSWVGFTENTSSLSGSAALIGWVFATHSGRIWNHQTGGGTNFGTSIPTGSIIGIAYSSSTHKVTVYVNGELWGTLPYEITGSIRPIIGRSNELQYKLIYKTADWTYTPEGTWKELPNSAQPVESGEAPLFRGKMRWLRLTNFFPSSTELSAITNLGLSPRVTWNKVAAEYDVTNLIIKWYNTTNEILMYAPSIPTGIYTVNIIYNNVTTTINNVSLTKFDTLINEVEYTENFTDSSSISNYWYLAQKTWGRGNNGVSADLVKIYLGSGEVALKAHGDQYSGVTRVGSCLVSKYYFVPGIFTMQIKLPPFAGACSALWPFHYEEAYPGFSNYQELLHEGLSRQGNEENGYYVVRNNEIDIETPTALMDETSSPSYVNGRFNVWQGELDNEYSSVFKPFFLNGKSLSDGQWHTLVIDWDNRINNNPKVSFYVDGEEITTLTTNVPDIPMRMWIGIWFPYLWAGANAGWDEQTLWCKSFNYVPYDNPYYRVIPETYPQDGLVSLTISNVDDGTSPSVDSPVLLKLTPSYLELAEQATSQLNVEVSPVGNYVIRWATSDLSIAEVSQTGIVTGINRGTTDITVSVGNLIARSKVTVIQRASRTKLSATIIGKWSINANILVGENLAYTCKSYLNLVTNEHQKPKFLDFIETGACPFAKISNTLDKAITSFDVDTASGDQLNIIGEWVGANRVLSVDTDLASLYFSFDIAGSGWDFALWYEDEESGIGLKEVPDTIYRLMVRAKIAANMWGGTSYEANNMWKRVFEGSNICFLDNFNMTMGVYVSGLSLDSIMFKLLTEGYLAIKPEGVRISYYVIGPEDPTAKVFAWSTNNDITGGWGAGYWGQRVDID
jgi:hypothetical protein